tara:strand:- start:2838 stop:3122 length:285 start_codon:yes stop_codon:yes gene_type:complete
MGNNDLIKELNVIKYFLDTDDEVSPITRSLYLENSLKFCVSAIERLAGENDSLWDILDEMKNSEIENHKLLLKAEIERKISEIEQLVISKPVDC